LTVTGVFSAPNFRFRCFRNTDIVSVSGVTIFDIVSDKKYENGNDFSAYRPFPTVFIPNACNAKHESYVIEYHHDYKMVGICCVVEQSHEINSLLVSSSNFECILPNAFVASDIIAKLPST
jgi:hypothetical protein